MLTVADLLRGPRPVGSEEDPLEHLFACHRRVEQRLETLARAGERFTSEREEALHAIAVCLDFFATNGVRHTADEERSLFPRLLPRLTDGQRAVIASLEEDHVTAGRLHAELHELAAGLHRAQPGSDTPLAAYRECVRQLTGLYRRHIEVEDTQVAAMAREHLSPADLAALSEEMKLRRRPEVLR